MIKRIGFNPFQRLLTAAAALLAATAVFPFGWLAERWPAFDAAMSAIFGAEAAHVAGHFLLTGGMGAMTLIVFPALRHRPARYAALMLLFGLLQESLQLLSYKKRPFMGADLFDIVVDLLGAAFVFCLFQMIAARWERNHDAE